MIWVLGAGGLLGKELTTKLINNSQLYYATSHELDITDLNELRLFVKNKKITWIVNCAAYTAVDKAESESEICFNVNAKGPKNIGILAEEIGARVIHISTDYVFNGLSTVPYIETDEINPISVYGKAKALGEINLMEVHERPIILRTSWLYGIYGSNFVNTMLRLMSEKDEIKIVSDQHGSPTWAKDLVKIIIEIIKNPPEIKAIYHASNEGITTWYDFGMKIYEEAIKSGILDTKRQVKIIPITSDQYSTAACRPKWSVLDKSKLATELGLKFPLWQNSLLEYLKIYKLKIMGKDVL